MKSSFAINRIAKYLVILILVASLIFGLYWLWQRQPKAQEQKTATVSGQIKEEAQETLSFKPQDTTVVTAEKIKFEGKTNPDSFVIIYSSDLQNITKTDKNGNFQKEVNLTSGLNLVDIVVFSNDFKESSKKTLTIFMLEEENKTKNTVYAGPVKTIFDTLITLTTPNGEKTLKASKQTTIKLPKENSQEKESATSALSEIRVGDYVIALGNISNGQLSAQDIEVIREGKPQNKKKFVQAKILSLPRQNIFSAKNEKEEKIIEFLLDKNSKISIGEKEGEIKDIAKDKNAFIFYHQKDNKNLVDLIYLLP